MWDKNKQSLCGEIPAGLLPAPQLVTVGSPESGSPGLPKTWQREEKETKHGRQESQSAQQITPRLLRNLFDSKVRGDVTANVTAVSSSSPLADEYRNGGWGEFIPDESS